jgi:hypothetical protein
MEDPAQFAPAEDPSRVLAEMPIAGLVGADGRETVIRIVTPEARARTPHVRTRAT